ncbi:hypothetical protein UlMin_041379 [Ulmus minor]
MGANLTNLESTGFRTSQVKPSTNDTSRIKEFNSKAEWKNYFNSMKEINKLVVIDFTAAWCGPCRSMEPFLKELADKNQDVEFVEVDVDELPDVAAEFGVQAMPTFVFLKKGDQVDKVVGARREDLQKKIQKHKN